MRKLLPIPKTMSQISSEGFKIIRRIFNPQEIEIMRVEADRISRGEGSACVRHLREKSRVFDQLAVSERLLGLLPKGLSPVRSILFDKTPEENWPVAWHQDLTITVKEKIESEGYGPWSTKGGAIHVQPPATVLSEMMTLRIHLDETSSLNGALRVIPKSHSKGKISSKDISAHIDASEFTCECDPGDVLLMSPLILHASKRSEKPNRRRIIHFEYAPLSSLAKALTWHESSLAK